MDATRYTNGAPPAEGWWPTRNNPKEDVPSGQQEYRYWHGQFWSVAADAECDEAQATLCKGLISPFTDDDIWWRGWTDEERAGKAPQPELPNADLF